MYQEEVDIPCERMVRKRKERHDDSDGHQRKGKNAKHYATDDMHNMERGRKNGKNHYEDSDDGHLGIERRESHQKDKHWKKEGDSQSREKREEHMKGSDKDSDNEHRGIERTERKKKDKDRKKERDCQSRLKRKKHDKGSDYGQQIRERRKIHDEDSDPERRGRDRREMHQKDKRQEEKYPKGHSYHNTSNAQRSLTKDLRSKSSGGDAELLVDLSERQQLEAPKLRLTLREESKPEKSPSPTLSDVESSARFDSRLSRGLRVSSDYAIVNEKPGRQIPNQQRGTFFRKTGRW